MKSIFISKRRLKLAGIYLMAVLVLVGGAGVFFDSDAFAPTASDSVVVEPYRSGPKESKNISLAINVDWGEEFLPDMLSIFEEHGISVTFFLTGRWCDNNPELAATLSSAGHELGNHGYSHASPNASSSEQIAEEISRTEDSIRSATGCTTRLYAPPSGEDDAHVLQTAAEMGYATILWSVDTIDWQKPSAETIIQRVKKKIGGGAIILAHPTQSTTEALSTIISDLQAEGYAFVTVSENLGL